MLPFEDIWPVMTPWSYLPLFSSNAAFEMRIILNHLGRALKSSVEDATADPFLVPLT